MGADCNSVKSFHALQVTCTRHLQGNFSSHQQGQVSGPQVPLHRAHLLNMDPLHLLMLLGRLLQLGSTTSAMGLSPFRLFWVDLACLLMTLLTLQGSSRVMLVQLWSSEVAIVSCMLKVEFKWLLSGSQQEVVTMQRIIKNWAQFCLPQLAEWMGQIQKFLLQGLLIGMQISGKEILAESIMQLGDCFEHHMVLACAKNPPAGRRLKLTLQKIA